MCVVAVNDQGQGVDLLGVDQNVELDQIGRLVTIKMIIQRSITAADRLETIEEVENHFVHRQIVAHLNLRAEEQHVVLYTTFFDAQRNDVAQVLLRHRIFARTMGSRMSSMADRSGSLEGLST